MAITIQCSYISDGKVVAQNKTATYVYKYDLNEDQTEKLLALLGKTPEINEEHWIVEWERSACGS